MYEIYGQFVSVEEKFGKVNVKVGSPRLYCMLETETLCIVEASQGGKITFTVWETERECVAVLAWTITSLIPISEVVLQTS